MNDSDILSIPVDHYTIRRAFLKYHADVLYEAEDNSLPRSVMIKIPKSNLQTSEEIITNEALTLTQLTHPHIHAVHDFRRVDFQGDDRLMLVLSHASTTLQRAFNYSLLDRLQIVRSVGQIAEALDYLHRRGFLHRGVAPSSVFLDEKSHAQLGAFGLAISLKQESDASGAGGVPLYMAPEQFDTSRAQLGPWTDVWGLGVMLYQGLTNDLPFGRQFDSWPHFLSTLVTTAPIPAISKDPSIPKELSSLCERCFRPEIKDRISSAGIVAQEIQTWLETNTASQSPVKVFISHSSLDRDVVERDIIGLLEGQGIKTWYSKVSIQSAAEWERSLLEGLRSSDWVLVAVSHNALTSHWVKDEVFWAVNHRPDRIIPVLMDDSNPEDLHIRLARLQHVDFRQPTPEARQKLIQSFQSMATD